MRRSRDETVIFHQGLDREDGDNEINVFYIKYYIKIITETYFFQ